MPGRRATFAERRRNKTKITHKTNQKTEMMVPRAARNARHAKPVEEVAGPSSAGEKGVS